MADFIKNKSLIYSLIRKSLQSQALLALALLDIALVIILLGLPNPVGVFVEGDAQRLAQVCQNNPNWRTCYGNELASITKQHNFDYTLQIIKILPTVDPKTGDCHILAHQATGAEIAQDPLRWEELVKKIDANSCNYGFVHGIVEGRSRFDPKFNLNEESIPQICETITKYKPVKGIDQTCAHIMGHVLLVEKDGSIPDTVNICEKIPQSLQYQCFSGTFMESFTRDNLVTHGLAKKIPWNEETIKAQEDLCRKYQGFAAMGCWQEISHMYSAYFHDDPAKVFEACSRAPNIKFRNECYQHAVASLTTQGPEEENYFASLCKYYEDNEYEYQRCTLVAVDSMMNASISYTDRALNYCSAIPEGFKDECFKNIAEALALRVSREDQIRLCQNAPENYRLICSGL